MYTAWLLCWCKQHKILSVGHAGLQLLPHGLHGHPAEQGDARESVATEAAVQHLTTTLVAAGLSVALGG